MQGPRCRHSVHSPFDRRLDRLGGEGRAQRSAGLPDQADRHEPAAAIHPPHHRKSRDRTSGRRGSRRAPQPPRASRAGGKHHRHLARDRARPPADRQGGPVRGPGAHHRRERHGQGAGGPLAPRQERALRGAVRRGQLRGHPLGTDRERTFRSRTGCIHLGHQTAQGQVRAGRRRHALHGRDRRHVAGGAGQGAAGAAREPVSAAWAATRTSRWTCG